MGYQHPPFLTAPPYMRPSMQELQMMQMQQGMGTGAFMPFGAVADQNQGLGDDEQEDADESSSDSGSDGGRAKSSRAKTRKKKILKCIL